MQKNELRVYEILFMIGLAVVMGMFFSVFVELYFWILARFLRLFHENEVNDDTN